MQKQRHTFFLARSMMIFWDRLAMMQWRKREKKNLQKDGNLSRKMRSTGRWFIIGRSHFPIWNATIPELSCGVSEVFRQQKRMRCIMPIVTLASAEIKRRFSKSQNPGSKIISGGLHIMRRISFIGNIIKKSSGQSVRKIVFQVETAGEGLICRMRF